MNTKIMPAVDAQEGRRRRHAGPRRLAKDFMIIFTAWAVTAYPILWLCSHVIGPALLGGQTP